MRAIAAADQNWGIGHEGGLLISLPEDQRDTFRRLTLGKTVVYGRKTMETFPSHRLLSDRKNIILSRDPSYAHEGALIMHGVGDVLAYESRHPEEEIWIIGGAEIYRSFLPYCEEAMISRIRHTFTADAYFPNLDLRLNWEKISSSDIIHSIRGYDFTVDQYYNHNICQ